MPDYLVGCGELCEPHQLLEYLLTSDAVPLSPHPTLADHVGVVDGG